MRASGAETEHRQEASPSQLTHEAEQSKTDRIVSWLRCDWRVEVRVHSRLIRVQRRVTKPETNERRISLRLRKNESESREKSQLETKQWQRKTTEAKLSSQLRKPMRTQKQSAHIIPRVPELPRVVDETDRVLFGDRRRVEVVEVVFDVIRLVASRHRVRIQHPARNSSKTRQKCTQQHRCVSVRLKLRMTKNEG